MAAELAISPEAANDIESAYAWYEKRRIGLGEEFLGCVDAIIQALSRAPEMYPKAYKEYRRALVRRFPYAVFYESGDRIIIIHAVFHTARDPEKWRERLS
jgi:plasmid stabilization system protein ParE